jgi:hypothetical protein
VEVAAYGGRRVDEVGVEPRDAAHPQRYVYRSVEKLLKETVSYTWYKLYKSFAAALHYCNTKK